MGIKIDILSNSRQRFLTYKSVASIGEDFNKVIEKGTAILDIGGGSIQLSVFENDTLVATQNMKLGVLRLQERLHVFTSANAKYEMLLDEMIDSQFEVFKKLYLKDRQIENMIIVDDHVSNLLQNGMLGGNKAGYISSESYEQFHNALWNDSMLDKQRRYGLDEESVTKLQISAALIRKAVKLTNANLIWAPGISMCDGMAYEYGEDHRLLKRNHDFEEVCQLESVADNRQPSWSFVLQTINTEQVFTNHQSGHQEGLPGKTNKSSPCTWNCGLCHS